MNDMNDIVQNTEAWLEARKGRLTASIAAGALGFDPHTSAKKAWRTILGTEPKRDNPAMAYGRANEDRAAEFYAKEMDCGIDMRPGGFWPHPTLWWLAASPDRLVGDDGLAEIKCPGTLPTAVPLNHRIQMLVQLACTGREWCDYFCWQQVGESEYATFLRRVHRAGIEGLLKRLEAFYMDYVMTGTEPPKKTPKRRKKVMV